MLTQANDHDGESADKRGQPNIPQTSTSRFRVWAAAVLILATAGLALLFWTNSNGSSAYLETPGQGHPHSLAVLPMPGTESPALWLATHDGLYLRRLGSDYALGWRRMGAPFDSTDVMAISSAKTPTSPIYIAGHKIGVQRSDDGGVKWRQLAPGAPARDVHALVVDPQHPDHVYIWAETIGMLATSNGGATWETLGKTPLNNPVQVIALAASRSTNALSSDLTLYAGSNLGLYISRDGGNTWSSSSSKAIADQPIYSLLAIGGGQPQSPELYAGAVGGAFHSPDGGNTWQTLSSAADLGGVGGLTVNLGADGQRQIYAVNSANQVFTSEDAGQTWNLVP